MPLSALFFIMMGVGGWLVYDAVTGKHPWEDFTRTVQGTQPAPNSVVTPAYPSAATVAAPTFGGSQFGGGALHP